MGQMQRHVFDPAKGFADMVSTTGGRVIYVSGHLGFGPDGKTVVEGGLGAQADALFDNIEETLAQAGATLDDLVRITAYIVDLDAYSEYAEVRRLRLGNNPPASTTVGVASLLAGALIEIDGVAFVAD
ncbi:MAG: RidA family protein [Acidimicrobiales bacterium]|nr:RidA family protein [Acidimicrobiales bacterium]